MSTTQITPIPTGTWRVDARSSELTFRARGMFGLAPVKGTFTSFAGTLEVSDASSNGELVIQAASLDTKNAKRDLHLRSADFFDVENHPTLKFDLVSLTTGAAGATIVNGVLRIRESALPVEAPVQVESASPRKLVLTTSLSVDRTAAGVGWSKMGMVQGKAHLGARLTLTK